MNDFNPEEARLARDAAFDTSLSDAEIDEVRMACLLIHLPAAIDENAKLRGEE